MSDANAKVGILSNGDRLAAELTKREYFAALAMQGMLAYSPADTRDSRLVGACTPSVMASHAIEMADALLARLESEASND